MGHGITAAWVGAPISGLSAEIAAGITYKTPTLKAVKDYVTDYVTAVNGVLTVNGFAGGITLNAGTALGLTSSSGNITLTNLGVQSFNGLTGAVGGVTTSVANTFVPMQSFSAGISAAGGTFTQRTVFISGIQSAGITASTVTSEGTSTISGYPGYASTTTVSPDTIKFVFDGAGGQILRPTDDNIDGSTRTNYLPASSGTLALTSQLMGAVNGSTAATTAVTSFNGLTGAVGGVCAASANTFTELQSFNSGVSCDSIINSKFLRVGDFDAVGVVPAYVDINSQQGRITSTIDGQDIVQHTTTLTRNYVQSDFLSGISASGITTSSLYVYGNAVVQGNMTVSGGVTFTISENVLIEDNIITLNSNVTGSPSENAGIEIERGTSANVQLLWNESSDKWTFTNDGSTYYDLPTSVVTSFNGNTGAVTGASLGANTFTGLNTFNAGVTTSFLYASTGSTFGSTLQVNGGATFADRVDVGGILDVVGGTTLESTLNVTGVSRFVGLVSAVAGVSTDSVTARGASLILTGRTSGAVLTGSRIVIPPTSSIELNGYNGATKLGAYGTFTYLSSLEFSSEDALNEISGSVTLTPPSYTDGAYTLYLPNTTNGTLALTSQLMGAVNGSTAATTAVTSFNGRTGAVQGVSSAEAGTGISVSAATGAITITNTGVQSFNGLTGAVTGVTVGGVNTFTQINTFSAGISAAGSTFASTTNTLDVIASTEGAGLRIARATSGVGSRIGGIRLGRSATSSQNTYIEGSAGTFSLYNGVDNTGALFAALSPSQFTLGTSAASFITLICPNNISLGDSTGVGNNQLFSISGTNRTYVFGDPTGVTTGFVGINRSGLCGDYALEVNSPTGKGLQLIYNDYTGAASNLVNMDVSSGGNFTVLPSGGLATVTGTLNVSAGLCAAGGTFSSLTQFTAGISAAGGVTFGGTVASDTGYRITSNAINAQTGTTYTFLSSDNGKVVTFNNASAVTVTIPTALPVGFNCTAIQLGAGQVGFTAASGVTLQSYGSQYRLIGQHASASIIEYSTNIVNLSGNLVV